MNFKRKIAAIATAAVCSLSALSISLVNLNKDNVYAVGMSGKTAFEITEQMTIGWNLGNSLDCANTGSTYSTAPKLAVTKWGNPEPTQELFDAVKAAGFNTVRIPTTWYEHIQKNSSGDWEISPDWLEYVKMTVDFAYNNDMFVILNVHHEDWVNVSQFTDETKAAAAEKLEDIWTQIAEEFKDYDQRLIFEGMNEPRQTYDPSVEWGAGDTYSWQYINDLNAIFVDVVSGQGSAENSERVLMLPGYVASSNPDTVRQIAIPEGSGNVALSVHAYLPYFFTMATDSYANHEYKADGSSASGWGGNYRDEINTFFNNMNTIQKEKNAPVIIGEFSASDFGNTDSRINWAKDYLGAAENAGIPCVLWDNNAVYTEGATPSGENHGYINRKNNMWYENSAPVIEAMMQTVGVTDYSIPVYTAQDFSWDNMKVGSDWIEIFKSTEGQETLGEGDVPFEWGNVGFSGFNSYLNEDYKFVVFADSDKAPALTLQNTNTTDSWNVVSDNGKSTQDYVYHYSYEDMKAVVESNGDSIDNTTNMYVSARGAVVTVYGVYAVPVNSQPVTTEPTTTEPATTETQVTETTVTTTEEPTETTTQQTTVSEEPSTEASTEEATAPSTELGEPTMYGDVNLDDEVTLADIALLTKYVASSELYPLKDSTAAANADVDHDGYISSGDAQKMIEFVLKVIRTFD